MKALKSARTLAASLGVLAVGALAATPAQAFDKVDWNWYKTINQNEYINVHIDLDVDTTGLVEVEKLQIFFGNLNAYSSVSNIFNYQDDDAYVEYIKYCYCYIPVWRDPSEYAPTELGAVKSVATAVGNNQSITSDVPVYLHDGQFVANTNENGSEWDDRFGKEDLLAVLGAGLAYNSLADANLHTALGVAFSVAAAGGLLEPASINAKSEVYNIHNLSVESSATAVGNNISVDLESDKDGSCGTGCSNVSNHIVIADITQFAYANLSAVSTVNGVHLDNYTGLRTITSPDDNLASFDPPVPVVSSVATAVGNNVSISVGKIDPTD
ncbi:MAG: hypothetical protein JNK07_09365 [Alphaproteobacteria bacterium]|nr:hypothetical protein [Alphaproteobacteria bacterium]